MLCVVCMGILGSRKSIYHHHVVEERRGEKKEKCADVFFFSYYSNPLSFLFFSFPLLESDRMKSSSAQLSPAQFGEKLPYPIRSVRVRPFAGKKEKKQSNVKKPRLEGSKQTKQNRQGKARQGSCVVM